MNIYHGTKDTVEKQLNCQHEFAGPYISNKFRYYTCKKCHLADIDVESEKEYLEILSERDDD